MSNPGLFEGRRVLELGSGCGLAGLAIALHTDARLVCLSDFASATMANLLYNVQANCNAAASAESESCLISDASSPSTVPWTEAIRQSFYARQTMNRHESCAAAAHPTEVRVTRVDWDDEDTWPRACTGAGLEAADRGLFDVVVAADTLYRRSYARKVLAVTRGVLRPGGTLVIVSPAAREGLTLLRRLLTESGAVADDVVLPDEWSSGNPLRSPEAAASMALRTQGSGPTATPFSAHDTRTGGDADRADGTAPVTLISDGAARALFPELSMPGYEISFAVFGSLALDPPP